MTKTKDQFGETVTKIKTNHCKAKSCIKCTESENSYDCERCVNYGTEENHKRCSFDLIKQLRATEAVQDCVGYYSNQKSCFLCEQKKFLFLDKNNKVIKCDDPGVKELKYDCIVGKAFQQQDGSFKYKCYVCKNGIPSKDNEACWKYEGNKDKFAQENVIFDDCEFGVRAAENSAPMCGTCTLDTFAVIGDRDNKFFGQCKRLQNDNKGCAKTVKGECVWCNFYRGYYMVKPGICQKNLEILGVFVIWFVILGFIF